MESLLITIIVGVVGSVITYLVTNHFKKNSQNDKDTARLGYESESLNNSTKRMENMLESIVSKVSNTETSVALIQKDFTFEVERRKDLSKKVYSLDEDVKKNNEVFTDLILRSIEAHKENTNVIANAINNLAQATSNHVQHHSSKS